LISIVDENKNDGQNVRNGYPFHGECPFKMGVVPLSCGHALFSSITFQFHIRCFIA
jgi:hypothetical protein